MSQYRNTSAHAGELWRPHTVAGGLQLPSVVVLCQNYGPFLSTLNIRGRIIMGTQKGTIMLTTNLLCYVMFSLVECPTGPGIAVGIVTARVEA